MVPSNPLTYCLLLLVGICLTGCPTDPEKPQPRRDVGDAAAADLGHDAAMDAVTIRVATYNVSLFRQAQGGLTSDLAGGDDAQARAIAEVLQRTRPDIVLLNEFDWDADGEAAQIFAEQYLAVAQNGAEPLDFPHWYVPQTNTGEHSGVDLDGNGEAVSTPGSQAYGNDAFGFGTFPGQYGMVIFSRYPIATDDVRTFRTLRWADMPGNQLPTDFYSADAIEVFRLSSKNHIDVPVEVEGHVVHMLASHPTPPSFDGPEDRNGRRNHDEIRFWVDYLTGGDQAAYITDDAGTAGALDPAAVFVVVGDLNSDPFDGDSRREALRDLLAHERVQDPAPESDGAEEAAELSAQANTVHQGDPRLDTADFNDNTVGNLRVDYVLPSANAVVESSGVFWPTLDGEFSDLVRASDHRLVWVDLFVPDQ